MIVNPFGGKIYHFSEVGSTMDAAKEHLCAGNLFIAERQTQGRGRTLQRQWQSERGKNLLFTLVLPLSDLHQPPLTLLAALALRRTLLFYNIKAKIKWPNDILIRQAKIAGILAEVYQGYTLLGVGINVNQTNFSIVNKAVTSMKLLLEKDCDLNEILSFFLKELSILVHCESPWNREINEHLWGKDQVVDYYIDMEHQKKITGKILCVQNDGGLQIRTDKGLEILYSAEI